MQYYYNICKEPITDKERSYSIAHYDRPLCRKHQEIAKIAKERLANPEQKTSKEPERTTSPSAAAKVPEPQQVQTSQKNGDALIQWLIQWVADKPVNLAVESKQFFLEGMRLEELARDLIGKAQLDILVTSPFVDSCFLASALQEARGRRVNVKVIARRPENTKIDRLKTECQENLKKAGIVIHYINQIHSKIIVIDSKIAIISSMNLYSGSTGGALLEAGIVSFEKKVVDSATKYIVDLLDRPESTDTTYSGSRYSQSYRRY
jgi:phosphatidylserine/phosphatidylglycerophosphate/cardiolipin synthase-like enzyme